MSLYVDEYFATGEVPGPGHNILTGRYACYDVYRCADDRWIAVGAIEPHFFANLCRALDCEQWLAHQTDDAVQDDIRADFAAAFARQHVRRVGRRARSGRHVRVGGRDRARARAGRALPGAPCSRPRTRTGHGDFEQVGWVLAGMDHAPSRADGARRDRHRHRRAARRGRLLRGRDRRPTRGRSRGVTSTSPFPPTSRR